MENNVFVGTHHKTGTHWMMGVFRELATVLNVPFVNASKMDESEAEAALNQVIFEKNHKVIVFHEHSRFSRHAYLNNSRGIHMIRDPLDVLISAVRYHESTDAKWVKIPKRKYGGRSVQETINGFEDFQDKLLFEIDDVGESNIRSLLNFTRGENFIDVKYEDLIVDDKLRYSARIFDFLGFDSYEVAIGCGIMWRNSLFGALQNFKSDHVKDGSAKQYLNVYKKKTRQRFDDKYGDIRRELGYRDDLVPGQGLHEIGCFGQPADDALQVFSLGANADVIESSMQKCIESAPHRAPAYMVLIRELVGRSEFSKAALVADSLLDALKSDAHKIISLVGQVSNLYIKIGRFEDAEGLLSEALSFSPNWAQGWYKLYRVKSRLRGQIEAGKVLAEGLANNPLDKRLREVAVSLRD